MEKLYSICAEAIRDCHYLEDSQVFCYWVDKDGCPVAVKPYDGIYNLYGDWGGYVIGKTEDLAWDSVCRILGKPRGVHFK